MTRPKLSAGQANRTANAKTTSNNAANFIGPITRGMSAFAFTDGTFSLIDIIRHALDEIGPAQLKLWTWVIAEYDVRELARLLAAEELTAVVMYLHKDAQDQAGVRPDTILKLARSSFGAENVILTKNHAKQCQLKGKTQRVFVRGSMNLNFNSRIEQFELSEGGPEFDPIWQHQPN